MDWHGAIALLFSFLFLNLDDDLQKTPTSFNTGRPRVPRAGKRPEHRRPGRARRGPPGDDRGHPRRGGVAAPAAGLDGAKVFFLSFFLFCFFDAPLRSPPLSPSTLFFLALFCPPPLSFSLSLHPPPPQKKKNLCPPVRLHGRRPDGPRGGDRALQEGLRVAGAAAVGGQGLRVRLFVLLPALLPREAPLKIQIACVLKHQLCFFSVFFFCFVVPSSV